MVALSSTLAASRDRAGTRASDEPCLVSGNRLLLVEDEPLVAMMMKEVLSDLDFEVCGPIGSVEEALKKVTSGEIHGAILDINLGGNSVYPVADLLVARRIPFVFVTGYGDQAIDERFAEMRVINKPVDRELLQACFTRTASLDSHGTAPEPERVERYLR
jgi:CheY-like chemotaxis protein